MNQKMLTIAAIVTAAALTGIFSTSPMAAYAGGGDDSETSTDQEVKQKNVGSGDAVNFNCAQNLIKAGVGEQQCGTPEEEILVVDGLSEEASTTTAPSVLDSTGSDIMDNPLFGLGE
jgi:hypothetical protein